MNYKYHFFWKSKLSNWAKSYFEHDGYNYCCGEQMMMHKKSLLFNDLEIAEKIMSTENPKEIKDLGRKVRNFNGVIWDNVKYDVVLSGLISRFKQDNAAKEELLKHKGKFFVEASPYDRIWGIGYESKYALANINNWGENLLGKILTVISNKL